MPSQTEFWIDVGGTFTDCLMRTPDDRLTTFKVLSSGVTKGRISDFLSDRSFRDASRIGDPANFWIDYSLTLMDADGSALVVRRVVDFDSATGTFTVDGPLPAKLVPQQAIRYELSSGEEAPILAIRTALKLGLNQPVPPVTIRLGTTRGTNALLTRRGARVGFVTTRGFRDVLRIANQDRPRLFDLAIQKPEPLFTAVVEIDERLDAAGKSLIAPVESQVRNQFQSLKDAGCESLAICLMHAFANPNHEALVEQVARDVGFTEISTSSKLAPLIKIVSRGDTTVLDAYLNPILRAYVIRLKESLGAGRAAGTGQGGGTVLKLMTSSGGLVDADRFTGKDSILSGPAGGVIGFSRVAERAGFARSIGFDMGGTSTDVSRFDGRYERELETTKAGVRVVSPMLAIETVAAGGGSICGFDGVKLFVGPQSAGADPGPACYGRGGPLTITDVNFYLGKIIPSRFPFPLDSAIVERRLLELCDQVAASPLGHTYTPIELAQGFLDIANTTMARAIRKISVARGYDPADYALVTFGGAGAQHACALARSLGMSRVLSHPYAGVLSAYGIGLADVRRLKEHSVLQPLNEESLQGLEPMFREMEQSATDDVVAEGISRDFIEAPICSLELRYRGIEGTILIEGPVGSQFGDAASQVDHFARAYTDRHHQLYGYVRAGRPLEIVAARVEVVGRCPDPVEPVAEVTLREPVPSEWTTTWFGGKSHSTGIFLRSDLQPGDRMHGPAILCEPTSTVIVDPGFTACILSRGEIVLELQRETEESPATLSRSVSADPVRIEIFNHLFASIAEQMGIALQQTSLSTNVKERLDFSCGIFSAVGDLVVNAPHIPVHLGAMSETVRRILEDNPDLRPGDVYVTNDPYRGGSHLPDVTVVTPVHDPDTSELLFVTASRAHHAEIGGIVPGSMPPFSRTLAEEGVLIRNFKLHSQHPPASHEAELRSLLSSGLHPSRSVDDNLADVAAQVAANNTGVNQLRQLVQRHSWPVVKAFMGHIQAAAAAKMRMALRSLCQASDKDSHEPAASRRFTYLDHLDDGSPIQATILIDDDRATVDFTGTGPVLATNLNANRAIVTAAVLYVFRCLIRDDIPLNSGVLEPVTIILPECLLNPPAHADPAQCAAMVGGNVETSQRVVDVLLGALGAAAASQGTMNNLTFGDGTFGYYETICGGSGATSTAAGADAVHTHMTNTRLTDPELIERRYPVRIHEFSIRPGSGGAGLHRGGDGITRQIEFLRPLRVSILSERRGPFAPFGLAGGQPGALGQNSLQRQVDGTIVDLGGKVSLDVQAGDVLTIQTPGGGGWGQQNATH
ncbi:MAG: hydantoinase B/oxoprolinase family protein [Planctomycetes bacterium]|nr:hydantoinase B/oxoprolinase family protein [Planctomycetota bacterium]